MAKFLIVKAVVFFTWWQSVLVAVLVAVLPAHVIPTVGNLSINNLAKGFQDFLVCIEMFPFAIAYFYAFPTMEFYLAEDDGTLPHPTIIRSLLSITNPLDIVTDVRDVVRHSAFLDNRPKGLFFS